MFMLKPAPTFEELLSFWNEASLQFLITEYEREFMEATHWKRSRYLSKRLADLEIALAELQHRNSQPQILRFDETVVSPSVRLHLP